ncbi:LysR family transcriptional regulator [Inhella proteolytica]|uniref:LysR family transcriptional regulator n=1 Tax=Inhella proteolytica TaxID=2795029 RepID=A0A931JAD4_9BURK|nr:LysR family transcriptional regulator [Inhella proteolytica]MBH9579337.1 LysR family transcriptional regulator [Inhella proteolytica]
MRWDLEGLAALDALVRTGSVAGAAQALHKVSSAVSYQVKRLEEQLGLSLIDRSGYRLRLTPEGEAVLAEGRRLLQQAHQLDALAQQLASGWEARLLLVVDGILPLADSLQALKTLADEGVPTRVQLKIEFLGGVQRCFEQEGADLMIAKDYRPHAQCRALALPELECLLCVAPQHPLLQLGRPARLADLHAHVELTVRDSGAGGEDRQMFGGERVFFLSGFVAKRQALLMGMGFGWMPRYLVDEQLARGELAELAYEGGSRYRFTPWLVQRLDKPLGRAGQRLVELLSPAQAGGA